MCDFGNKKTTGLGDVPPARGSMTVLKDAMLGAPFPQAPANTNRMGGNNAHIGHVTPPLL